MKITIIIDAHDTEIDDDAMEFMENAKMDIEDCIHDNFDGVGGKDAEVEFITKGF